MSMAGGLKETVEAIKKDIESKEAEKIIEDVLEIRREQTYINGKWETIGYFLVLTVGGPTVWLDTSEGILYGTWGMDVYKVGISEEKIREIEEYLDTVFEE